jgi:hypothetical protein
MMAFEIVISVIGIIAGFFMIAMGLFTLLTGQNSLGGLFFITFGIGMVIAFEKVLQPS